MRHAAYTPNSVGLWENPIRSIVASPRDDAQSSAREYLAHLDRPEGDARYEEVRVSRLEEACELLRRFSGLEHCHAHPATVLGGQPERRLRTHVSDGRNRLLTEVPTSDLGARTIIVDLYEDCEHCSPVCGQNGRTVDRWSVITLGSQRT